MDAQITDDAEKFIGSGDRQIFMVSAIHEKALWIEYLIVQKQTQVFQLPGPSIDIVTIEKL